MKRREPKQYSAWALRSVGFFGAAIGYALGSLVVFPFVCATALLVCAILCLHKDIQHGR
jgi:hypothetical protein